MDHASLSELAVPLLVAVFCWFMVSTDRRLRSMEQTLSALLRHFNIDLTATVPPSDRVKALAADPARKIEAMRLYRQETGADLRAAMTVVEGLARRD
jgi:hypothetical protein